MLLNWFHLQKKQIKILIISGLATLLIVLYFAGDSAYWKYQYFKGLEKQVKQLAVQNKQLKKDVDAIDIDKERHQKIIDLKNRQIDSLKTIANTKKNETKSIPDIVRAYPDRKLDSILTNYRHPQRD